MSIENILKLRRSLVKHEKKCNFPYLDTKQKISIGIGFNLTDRGIDDDWINRQYNSDVTYFQEQLNTFPWFKELNDDRKIILVDMAFMGWKNFLEFEKMIEALSNHDYKEASMEMLDSDWANEVKGRATELAQGMLLGVYNP